jgi:hypothetical protein
MSAGRRESFGHPAGLVSQRVPFAAFCFSTAIAATVAPALGRLQTTIVQRGRSRAGVRANLVFAANDEVMFGKMFGRLPRPIVAVPRGPACGPAMLLRTWARWRNRQQLGRFHRVPHPIMMLRIGRGSQHSLVSLRQVDEL